MANTSGVFTLDQLLALGQTGDLTEDLTAGDRLDYLSNIQALEAFQKKQDAVGSVRAKIPAGTKAGYYQVPGQQGAEYYDPATGNASEALAQYLTTGKDQFGAPPAPAYGGDTGDAHRASTEQGLARIAGSIFYNAKSQGISLQQAQDQQNNTGAYQKYVIGPNGEKIAMKDVPNTVLHPDTGYTDMTGSTAGAFDRLTKETGQTAGDLAKLLGSEDTAALQAKADYFKTYKQDGTTLNYAYEKPIAPGSPVMMDYTPEQLKSMSDVSYWTNLRDSLAANYEKTAQAQQGIQQNRVARGLDPATGISANEKQRISDIYNRIQDPAQKSMFIKAQDPGNLTAAELVDQQAARAPELAAIAKANESYQTTDKTHFFQGKYYPGEITITSGAQVATDPSTGRSAFIGSTPFKLDYAPPKDTSRSFAGRMGGAIAGGFAGWIGSMGSPSGLIAGMWAGAGGWMPNASNIGLKKGGFGIGSGFSGGSWSGGKMAQGPQMISGGIKAFMIAKVMGVASGGVYGGISGMKYGLTNQASMAPAANWGEMWRG